jgi:uncharacterized protein YoxC
MVIDEQRVEQIKSVFKAVWDLKDQAKELNATATENMKALAESMSTEPEEIKTLKKSLAKAYKEYVSIKEGEPDSLMDALDIIAAVSKG